MGGHGLRGTTPGTRRVSELREELPTQVGVTDHFDPHLESR
jgi:hypothetical protein